MTETFHSKNLPSYKNPPVIEVTCGITFDRLEAFKAPHLGLFWETIREEFPEFEQVGRIGALPQELDLGMLPLPRIWYIQKDKNGVIQVQDDRFHYNWRRVKPGDVYPRYDTVIKTFKEKFQSFEDFVKEYALGTLTPQSCELTYINHILRTKGWTSITDVGLILQDLNWADRNERFLPHPSGMLWQVSFDLPEDHGQLFVRFQRATRAIDKQELFILELKTLGLGSDKSPASVWNWFDLAHEWIVRGFSDVTGEEIQRELWQREDEN